ncbi:hypothetical protein QNI16_19970 [Cytophagaceae bacterium YF14B1]|uniref:Uncharacterized protein n=1 Tax=Xanthocytophaga flava TaxID=3048013 RepID=A0AAE3QSW0_9BACT|nr:hypothetical protein [Xanthocytophaga flavus]MDJ1482788.1 hypothetical protein [Xanthocytophaga flavus]
MVSTVVYNDVLDWQHDVSLEMAPQPMAQALIVSPTLKCIVEQFCCPEHRFYPASTTNYFNDSDQEKAYFVFHLRLREMEEKLFYPKTVFGIFENYFNDPQLVSTYSMGEIVSLEHYKEADKEISERDFDTRVAPVQAFYQQPYEVLWGEGKNIIVSENVKEAIEEANLRGVVFEEFTSYEIVTSSQG